MAALALCCRNTEGGSGSRTSLFQRFSCGVGHVMNDIARQLLISFRLVFFMKVLGLSAANAGWLMLYGVLIVAAMMPVSAFLIDRISIPFLSRKLGRKKSWHFIATVVAAIVIPLYYSPCLPCQSSGEQWQLMLYLAMLNTCLAFAVGTLEIGHLSIIPDIAKNQSEAVELNVWRTTFTFLSGITTYLVAWAVFGQNTSDQVSAESSMDFTVTTLILVGIGLLFALIFHWGTKEPKPGELGKTTSAPAEAAAPRKNSFVPWHSRLPSMTYMEADLHCPKEMMRDRFIESLKEKDSKTNEEGSPARKKSFARHFINALFTADDETETQSNDESTSENRNVSEITALPQSKGPAQYEDQMLKDVKELPNERKISVLMSIVYGLIGVDPATIERPELISDKTEPSRAEAASKQSRKYGVASIGIHNKGLDHDDAEFCCPDGIDDTKISSNRCTLDTSKTNSGPSSSTVTTKEVSAVSYADPEADLSEKSEPKTIRSWLKDPHLYKVTLIFTCAKVLEALSFSYLPFYLIYRIKFEKDAIAYLPMIMLVSATLSSGFSKKLIKIIGSKSCFMLAALVVIGSGVWFYFIKHSNRVMVYPAVVLLGFGFSTMLVNSLSFAAELIGDNKSTSGFVFAFMGLMSRLTRGALITTIQKLFPEERGCEECGEYVRVVFSFVPGALAAMCLLILLFFQVSQSICPRKDPQRATKGEKNGVENTRF